MARRNLDEGVYSRLCEAYRIKPGNHSHAGIYASVDRQTAKVAWEKGWVRHFKDGRTIKPWAHPIKDVIDDEANRARARRLELEQEEAKKTIEGRIQARREAIETLAQEGRIVSTSRANIIALGASLAKISQGALVLAERLKVELTNLASGSTTIDANEAVWTMNRIAHMARQISAAGRDVIEMERSRVGDPNEVLENTDTKAPELTADEAVFELERLERTLRRARAKGIPVDLAGQPDLEEQEP